MVGANYCGEAVHCLRPGGSFSHEKIQPGHLSNQGLLEYSSSIVSNFYEEVRCVMEFEPEITAFRPDRSGIRKVLGDLEAQIMELIWARPASQGTTVRDVFEILYQQRQIAYTTVMSTMSRLAKKQFLRIEKHEQTYVYTPTMTEQEFISRFVSHILQDLFISFSDATLQGLEKLSKQEVEQARQYLAEIMYRRQQEED